MNNTDNICSKTTYANNIYNIIHSNTGDNAIFYGYLLSGRHFCIVVCYQYVFKVSCSLINFWLVACDWCIFSIYSEGILRTGGRFKNAYELLNLRALKIPMLYKNRIFQCMSKIFCVAFQRVPLKYHTKYLTHTFKDVNFIHRWNFKSS